MSKASALIIEAMERFPEKHEQQVAFVGEAIGKIVAQQLRQYQTLIATDAIVTLIEVLEALKLPDGPLYIPGEEQNPLFESGEQLNQYVHEKMPQWIKELEEAPQS